MFDQNLGLQCRLSLDLIVNIHRQSFLNANFNFQVALGLEVRRCEEQA